MIASEPRTLAKAKQTPTTRVPRKSKSPRKLSPTCAARPAEGARPLEQMTKHDRVLTLLNRREGVTIPELMNATDWQKHSVRGFLAGTVKKKLGFTLTSTKVDGELRRYRIEAKRGR